MENFFDEEAIANLYQESSSAISAQQRMLLLMCVLIMVDRIRCIFPLLQYALSDGKKF